MCFKEDMMTIGTGAGTIYFFDLRAGHYLEHDCGHPISVQLGKGWLVSMVLLIWVLVSMKHYCNLKFFYLF